MTRKLLSALLILLLSSLATAAFAVRTGAPAPDFNLKDTAGRSFTLSSFKGKPVVLNFWATNCPPCLAELPSLENLYRDLAKSGVVVIGIAVEKDIAPVKDVITHKKLTFPILIDTDKSVSFDSYGLFGLPITIIIDKKGIVTDRIIGGAEWDSPAMKEKLKKLL